MTRSINLACALLLAAGITFVLFFLMQLLIASGGEQPQRGERVLIGDLSIPEIVIEPRREEPKPLQPEEPAELPKLPDAQYDTINPEGPGLPQDRVDIQTQNPGGMELAMPDAEYLPIVTIEPEYPRRALLNGIEGWCLVSFTVNENGGVDDPVVVDAEPPGIFDRASLRAISRFKFNPRTVDGRAVRTPGVQYVLTYELAD